MKEVFSSVKSQRAIIMFNCKYIFIRRVFGPLLFHLKQFYWLHGGKTSQTIKQTQYSVSVRVCLLYVCLSSPLSLSFTHSICLSFLFHGLSVCLSVSTCPSACLLFAFIFWSFSLGLIKLQRQWGSPISCSSSSTFTRVLRILINNPSLFSCFDYDPIDRRSPSSHFLP